jgi:hypothetical protein
MNDDFETQHSFDSDCHVAGRYSAPIDVMCPKDTLMEPSVAFLEKMQTYHKMTTYFDKFIKELNGRLIVTTSGVNMFQFLVECVETKFDVSFNKLIKKNSRIGIDESEGNLSDDIKNLIMNLTRDQLCYLDGIIPTA